MNTELCMNKSAELKCYLIINKKILWLLLRKWCRTHIHSLLQYISHLYSAISCECERSKSVILFPVDGCRPIRIRKLHFEERAGKKGDVRQWDVERVSTWSEPDFLKRYISFASSCRQSLSSMGSDRSVSSLSIIVHRSSYWFVDTNELSIKIRHLDRWDDRIFNSFL